MKIWLSNSLNSILCMRYQIPSLYPLTATITHISSCIHACHYIKQTVKRRPSHIQTDYHHLIQ